MCKILGCFLHRPLRHKRSYTRFFGKFNFCPKIFLARCAADKRRVGKELSLSSNDKILMGQRPLGPEIRSLEKFYIGKSKVQSMAF